MDGLKLHLQQSGYHAIQNAFYNGWKHDLYVSNIFLFMPDGPSYNHTTNTPPVGLYTVPSQGFKQSTKHDPRGETRHDSGNAGIPSCRSNSWAEVAYRAVSDWT
eukprot:14687509-Ditylum_brightwellii.AAC.1